MKRIYFLKTVALLAAAYLMASCGSDPEVVPESGLNDLKMLTEMSVPDTELSIKVYQHSDELIVGYNKFEVLVSKSGVSGAYTNAEILLKPMMIMSTMSHACPVENPVLGVNYSEAFAGAAVFVMPTGEMGTWSLTMEVKDTDTDESGEVMIPITVNMPDESRMKSFSVNYINYFVSLVEPSKPEVGINDFEITIHKKESMMMWPAVSGFTVEIEPEMPDMGHGSPNNENPVHASMGHYKGKVNFTMDGYWKINLDLEIDGQVQELSFDITFEHSSTK